MPTNPHPHTCTRPGKSLILFDPRLLHCIDGWAHERKCNRSTMIRDIVYTAVHQRLRGEGTPTLRRAPRYIRPMGLDPGNVRTIQVGPGTYEYCEVDREGMLIEHDAPRIE